MAFNKNSYPWDLGTQLSIAIQCGKAEGARDIFFELLNVIEKKIHPGDFSKIKLRAIQITTLLIRGAYNAGADADNLMEKNIQFINWIYNSKSLNTLKKNVERIIEDTITLIPENNYYDNKRINKATAYINKNYNQMITRHQIAKVIGVSESYVSKLFLRVTGYSFKEYVLRVKIAKAEDLLQNTKYTINEVAYKIGYSDPNYFSTIFKKIIGIPPGKFRKKSRNHEVVSSLTKSLYFL